MTTLVLSCLMFGQLPSDPPAAEDTGPPVAQLSAGAAYPNCICHEGHCPCYGTPNCGCTKPQVEQYRSAFELSKADSKTLVVFVRQDSRGIPGCRGVRYDAAVDGAGPAVLVGTVLNGRFQAPVLLPGDPSDDDILKAASWNRLPLNHGSCPCNGNCHCQPHGDCAAGKCYQHNPTLAKPAPISFVSPAFGVCRT